MEIKVGTTIDVHTLFDSIGNEIVLPVPGRMTHLQFRRFAGCPVCNVHLSGFKGRYHELENYGINEIVFFRSSDHALRPYQAVMPFPLIGDPSGKRYKEFGVTHSYRSVADPRSWLSAIKGLLAGFALPESFDAAFGLPADFLISGDGNVLALKYGVHADDHWSVDEVIELATTHSV